MREFEDVNIQALSDDELDDIVGGSGSGDFSINADCGMH